MKNKKLLTAIVVAAVTTLAGASDGSPRGGVGETGNASQQVVVNNYYSLSGYEYASRIMRFHTSYVTFDFYSPVFTEIYWYRYTPYTWGVSIYDDWYYYGAGVTSYAWRSGYGGSYWWGYDRWMGYGWNSGYSPVMNYSVNFYLGRPHYHYPVAYNNWCSYRYGNYARPVTVVNNNTNNYYYGSEKRNSYQGGSSGYNPTNPVNSVRRSGYTSTGGRSSASGTATASSGTSTTEPGTQGRSQAGTAGRTQTGTRSQNQSVNQGQGQGQSRNQGQGQSGNHGQGQGQSGNQGQGQSDNSTVNPSGSDKEKSNNGLRMGQYRRGVAAPADPADNGLPRTNNPNVDDRTDPGREKNNASRTTDRQQTRPAQNSVDQPMPSDRAPARTLQRTKIQSTVKTVTQSREAAIREGTTPASSSQREKSVRKSSGDSNGNSSEAPPEGNVSKKNTTSSSRKR